MEVICRTPHGRFLLRPSRDLNGVVLGILAKEAGRLREISRAREVVADFFAGPYQYGSTAASLQKYFDAYAVAARR